MIVLYFGQLVKSRGKGAKQKPQESKSNGTQPPGATEQSNRDQQGGQKDKSENRLCIQSRKGLEAGIDVYKELVVHEQTGYRVPSYWMECDRRIADYSGLSEWLVNHLLNAQSVAVDVPSMAAAMTRLIGDERLRRTWGENGRRRARALFDWRRVIEQHLDLWRTLHHEAVAAQHTPARKSWFRPEYCKIFQHYSTTMLSSSAKVYCGSPREFSLYPELEGFLTPDVLNFVMQRAASASTVGELEASAVSILGVPADVFRNHLMWLIKYDHSRLDSLA